MVEKPEISAFVGLIPVRSFDLLCLSPASTKQGATVDFQLVFFPRNVKIYSTLKAGYTFITVRKGMRETSSIVIFNVQSRHLPAVSDKSSKARHDGRREQDSNPRHQPSLFFF